MAKKKTGPLNLSGCADILSKGFKDLELLAGLGEELSEKERKAYAARQVAAMNTRIRKHMANNIPQTQAVEMVKKHYLENHAQWVESTKKGLLQHQIALNNALGACKFAVAGQEGKPSGVRGKVLKFSKDKNDFDRFTSGYFDSDLHFPDEPVHNSLSETAARNTATLSSAFQHDLAQISVDKKISFANVADELVNWSKQGQVQESMMQDFDDDSVSTAVGKAINKANEAQIKLMELAGGNPKSLGKKYIAQQWWDTEKMNNPSPEIWAKYETASPESLTSMERQAANRRIFAKELAPLFDWELSYADKDTDTLAKREAILADVFDTINGLHMKSEQPQHFTLGEPFIEYLENRARQLFALDGFSRAEMSKKYGRDLYQNISSDIHSTGKNSAVLQRLGPRPQAVMDEILDFWKENSTLEDWKARKKELTQIFDSYTKFDFDRAGLQYEQLAKNLKNIALVNNVGWMGVNSFPDSVPMLIYLRAMNASGKAKVVMGTFAHFFSKGTRAQNAEFIKLFDMAHSSLVDSVTEQILNRKVADGEPGAQLGKITHWLAKWGRLTMWDEALRLAINKFWSKRLYESSDTEFAKLPAEVKDIFTQYGINEREWNYIRNLDVAKINVGKDGYLVPKEYMKLSDKHISEMYDIPIGHKNLIEKARIDFSSKMNSAMMYQSNYVVPKLNAKRDRQYQFNKVEAVNTGPAAYVLFEVMSQYKQWAFNFSDVVMGRINHGRGTAMTRLGRNLEMLVGVGAAFSFLDFGRAVLLNRPDRDYDPKHPLSSILKSTATNTIMNAGVYGFLLGQLVGGWSGRGGGVKAPVVGTAHHYINGMYGVIDPGPRSTRWDKILSLFGDMANVNPLLSIFINQIFGLMYSDQRKHTMYG